MNLVYVFNHICEAVAVYCYIFSLYEHKRARRKDVIAVAIAYLLLFFVFINENIQLNQIASVVINIALIYYLQRAEFVRAVKDSLVICVATVVSELLVDVPMVLFRDSVTFEPTSVPKLLVASAVVKILYGLLLWLIVQYKKSKWAAGKYSDQNIILVTLLLFLAYLSLLSIQNLGFVLELNDKQFPWVFVVLFSVFALGLAAVLVINQLQNKQDEYLRAQSELQQMESERNYEKLLVQQDKDQKILIHDIKNHVQVIAELLEKKEYDAAKEHLAGLTDAVSLKNASVLAHNKTLTVLLNRYVTLCKEAGITLTIETKNADLSGLSSAEITSLFCNLLDNAMDAAMKCDNPFIDLKLNEDKEKGNTVLLIVNNCITSPVYSTDGQILSDKTDRRGHGIGLKSVERIAAKHQGFLHHYYNEDDHTFHVAVMLYMRK